MPRATTSHLEKWGPEVTSQRSASGKAGGACVRTPTSCLPDQHPVLRGLTLAIGSLDRRSPHTGKLSLGGEGVV